MRYIIANFLISILPPTRCFYMKRWFLNWLGVQVGESTRICGGVRFYGGGNVRIGSHCWIGLDTRFYTSSSSCITIGENCDIAPRVTFTCGSHEVGGVDRRAGYGTSQSITIGRGSWIGICSVILGGTQIGQGSIVGAGAVITSSTYADNSLLLGVPAKVARTM